MRTLTFEQITDSRNNEDEYILCERIDKIKELLSSIKGIRVFHDGVRKLEWDEPEYNTQYRCRFYVKKDTRKITWNDVYGIVNSVKTVPYEFVNYVDWNAIKE